MKDVCVLLSFTYLFFFSLYHIITGVVSVFFSDFALRFYKFIYGAEPIETKQLLLTFKPWGNLALIMGIIGFFALFNINTYYPLLFAFSLLLMIRVGYRSLLKKQAYQIFKITSSQNLRMILIQLLGIILFLYLGFTKLLPGT